MSLPCCLDMFCSVLPQAANVLAMHTREQSYAAVGLALVRQPELLLGDVHEYRLEHTAEPGKGEAVLHEQPDEWTQHRNDGVLQRFRYRGRSRVGL